MLCYIGACSLLGVALDQYLIFHDKLKNHLATTLPPGKDAASHFHVLI